MKSMDADATPRNDHDPKRGWLRHGNPPGDLSTVPQCGAKNRRQTSCRAPAMKNGRCKFHGGLSTSTRTPEGLERSRRARWIHGGYSLQTRALLRENRRRWRELLALLSN